MWCVSSAATTEESPPWFVWVRQQRNEGGRTERWREVGGEGMMVGEWWLGLVCVCVCGGGAAVSESGQCTLNFKKGIDKGEGRRRRFEGEKGGGG